MRRTLAAVAALAAVGAWLYVRQRHAAPPASPGATHFQLEITNRLLVEQELNRVVASETSKDPRRLARFEASIYSQFGEDGIIAEIFRRIGTTNRYFVEFGSGDGNENNTVLLLHAGWRGLWLDAEPQFIRTAKERFRGKPLQARQAFINAENVAGLFRDAGVPQTFDLLSIDIDRNDYWVWKALSAYMPRVVVIEYNPVFPPGIAWVVDYQPEAHWDNTSHFGASLTALERLGAEKGYALVACNIIGTNAFFVRRELLGHKFAGPFTAEGHYQPARYHLVWYKSGHPRRVGPPGLIDWPGKSQ